MHLLSLPLLFSFSEEHDADSERVAAMLMCASEKRRRAGLGGK